MSGGFAVFEKIAAEITDLGSCPSTCVNGRLSIRAYGRRYLCVPRTAAFERRAYRSGPFRPPSSSRPRRVRCVSPPPRPPHRRRLGVGSGWTAVDKFNQSAAVVGRVRGKFRRYGPVNYYRSKSSRSSCVVLLAKQTGHTRGGPGGQYTNNNLPRERMGAGETGLGGGGGCAAGAR